MSIRLLTVKNNSHADMRTSNAQLLEKGCQHEEEGEYITGEKVKIIEILFLFRLPAG